MIVKDKIVPASLTLTLAQPRCGYQFLTNNLETMKESFKVAITTTQKYGSGIG